MFRHVIVGVDGRPAGRDAITLGLQLVDPDGTISLAHVHPGERKPRRSTNLDFDRVENDESMELLEGERKAASIDAGLLSIGDASVGGGLHRLAEQHNGDLIVVGCSHRGRAGRVLLGDDTRATLGNAPCAVAVAPAGYASSARPLGTIGVAYDTSPQSRVALAVARALATREDAGVRARRVIAYPGHAVHERGALALGGVEQGRASGARQALELPADTEGDVVMGRVQDELEVFSGQVDVLVVGSREHGPVRRAVLGSTGQQLARTAKCPLLVVVHEAAVPLGSPRAPTRTPRTRPRCSTPGEPIRERPPPRLAVQEFATGNRRGANPDGAATANLIRSRPGGPTTEP